MAKFRRRVELFVNFLSNGENSPQVQGDTTDDGVTLWPISKEFCDELVRHKKRGRHIVAIADVDMQTASEIKIAYPFIDDIVYPGTDTTSQEDVAAWLGQRFAEGFDYAGCSEEEIPALSTARRSYLVNASPSTQEAVNEQVPNTVVLDEAGAKLKALTKSLRLHQWAKNTLVFVPIILGGKVFDLAAWPIALFGFLAISLIASATYILNDLIDLPNDRRHWSKRRRPLASGTLPIRAGVLASSVLLVSGLAIGLTIGPAVFAILAIYLIATTSYSLLLKAIPIVDVLVLGTLFTLRIGLGIFLVDVALSPWLLIFSMFVFLSLSLAKRHTEIARMVEANMTCAPGRGYHSCDGPLTLSFGVASAISSILIMVLYLIEDAMRRPVYSEPQFLWLVPPILFLFLGRIWLVSHRGQLDDDPVVFAIKDRVCLVLGGSMCVFTLVAIIGIKFL